MIRALQGKTGLVTGAASGIGRATAIAFAREGANVVVADLDQAATAAQQTVAMIEDAGGSATFIPVDVTDAQSVRSLVETTVATYGRLDVAHNNAGIGSFGYTAEVSEEDFDRVVAVNLKGVWLCLKYEIEQMQKQGGGAIINTASLAGLTGSALVAPYVATKHAVVGLTKSAAAEYANQNIRINAVAPGAIATPMIDPLAPEQRDHLIAPHALHRFGTPEEVAEAVLWLASDKSSFAVGSILSVDGGATATPHSYDPVSNPAP